MKCKNPTCNNELQPVTGKVQPETCCPACKQAVYRLKKAGRLSESPEQPVTPTSNNPTRNTQPVTIVAHAQSCESNVTESATEIGYRPFDQLGPGEYNRVPVPGDPDYQGCCIEINGEWMTKRQAKTRGLL